MIMKFKEDGAGK